MASLSHPNLVITLASGTSNVHVQASVTVTFSAFELALMKLGLKGRLRCELWGKDGTILTGGDDNLLSFNTRTVTSSGTQTFSRTIPSSMLNEDIGRDEVYAAFMLSSNQPTFSMDVRADSPVVTGFF